MNFKKTIRQKAEVDPTFAKAVKAIQRERIDLAKYRMSDNDKQMLSFLRSISTGEGKEREAIRLQSMPYQKLSAVTQDGETYLVGHTRPLTVTMNDGQEFHPGPYYVFIPSRAVIHVSPQLVHLIPQSRPRALGRHPHHYASTDNPKGSPLSFSVNTCLGSFDNLMMGLYRLLDITGVFQAWHLYLTRWNEASQLCRSDEMYAIMRGEIS